MDNDDIPVGRILNRRELLALGAAGALVLTGGGWKRGGMAFAQGQGGVIASPALTEGPYFVDERLNRSDIRDTRVGLPMQLGLTVAQLKNGTLSPLPDYVVDIWHADAMGVYSDIASENTTGEVYLRGYQTTNAHGAVKFTTIYPGWYQGRTVHIHVKIRQFTTSGTSYEFSTQLFMNDTITDQVYQVVSPYNTRPARDTRNSADGIYTGGSDNNVVQSNSGAYLMLRLAADKSHAVASFQFVLDLAAGSFPGTGGGGAPGGGPGGGGAPPGGGSGTPPPGGGMGGPPPGP